MGLAAGLCAIVGTVLGPGLSKGIGGTRGKKDYGAILAMKPASAYSFSPQMPAAETRGRNAGVIRQRRGANLSSFIPGFSPPYKLP